MKGDEEEEEEAARLLRLYLTDFLYNDGAVHRLGINFEDGAEISCGSEAPKIKAQSVFSILTLLNYVTISEYHCVYEMKGSFI